MRESSSPTAQPAGMYDVGSYLTDGGVLLSIVGNLPQSPALRLVEDCRTLEVMIMTIRDLEVAGLQPVDASYRQVA